MCATAGPLTLTLTLTLTLGHALSHLASLAWPCKVHASSLFPDEHFVHTALMASPLRHTLKKNHLRFWKWDWQRDCKVAHPFSLQSGVRVRVRVRGVPDVHVYGKVDHQRVVDLYGKEYIPSHLHPCFLVAEV